MLGFLSVDTHFVFKTVLWSQQVTGFSATNLYSIQLEGDQPEITGDREEQRK